MAVLKTPRVLFGLLKDHRRAIRFSARLPSSNRFSVPECVWKTFLCVVGLWEKFLV